jgi:hypothetical protein
VIQRVDHRSAQSVWFFGDFRGGLSFSPLVRRLQ